MNTWPWLGWVLLALIVVIAHGSAIDHEFLALGDQKLLAENPGLNAVSISDQLRWAWADTSDGVYKPIAWTSHIFERALFGEGSRESHALNLLLHFMTAALLATWISRLTSRPAVAWLAAGLFAAHPLQVQTVAWLSERPGLLAALFAALALERNSAARKQPAAHVLATLAFVASILSKPVYVLLPLVFLLEDRLVLDNHSSNRKFRMGQLAVGGLGAFLALKTMLGIEEIGTLDEVGVWPRFANLCVGIGSSLRRFVAPYDLATNHPFRFDHNFFVVMGWMILLIAASVLAWRIRKRAKHWTFGWFAWLLLFLPTSGVIQFGAQSSADRFTYLPLVGLSIAAVLPWRIERWPRWTWGLVALVILGLGTTSRQAHTYWQSSIPRLQRDLELVGDTAPSLVLLAEQYKEQGNAFEALRYYNRAQLFGPEVASLMHERADLLLELGNYADAYELYRDVLRREKEHGPAYAQIGRIYVLQKNYEMAGRAFRRAMLYSPEDAQVRVDTARLMGLLEDPAAQLGLYQEALELDADLPGIRAEMSWVYATSSDSTLRNPGVALRLAETEIRMSGSASPNALEARAAALAGMGRSEEARELSMRAELEARELGNAELARSIKSRRSQYLAESR